MPGYWFDNPQNWISYGGRPKNWDTVGNQQTNPVGALVELVTNGIDAILLRKARESGVEDFRSARAPQGMFEAVKRYFPGVVTWTRPITSGRWRCCRAERGTEDGIRRMGVLGLTHSAGTLVMITVWLYSRHESRGS